MKTLPKIAFVLEGFQVPGAGQQLLDRFLIGYHFKNSFRTIGARVILAAPKNPHIATRVRQFGLVHAMSIQEALRESAAAVVVPSGDGSKPNDALVQQALELLPPTSRCFVYGLLAADARTAGKLQRIAIDRGVTLMTGSAPASAFRLPPVNVNPADVQQALAVTFGPTAAFDALEILRALLGRRLDQPASNLVRLHGDQAWQTAYSTHWSGLLASAISRSNTIKGDPEKDGRTQDVFGLKLIERLCPRPGVWVIDFADGLQCAVFDLTGALEDLNLAVRVNGAILSTQFYRPPLPMQDHFSPLAEQIESFFRSDHPPTASTLTALPYLFDLMQR